VQFVCVHPYLEANILFMIYYTAMYKAKNKQNESYDYNDVKI
jgi:hypothetical protein